MPLHHWRCTYVRACVRSAVYEWMKGNISGALLEGLDTRLLSGQVDPNTMRNYYETPSTTQGHQGAGTSTGVFKHTAGAAAAAAVEAAAVAGAEAGGGGEMGEGGWVDAVTADGLAYQHHLTSGEVRAAAAGGGGEQTAKRPRHDAAAAAAPVAAAAETRAVSLGGANPLAGLRSCYAQPHPSAAPGAPGEPAFTTYHKGSHSTVDYIWHDGTLVTEQVLEMQTQQLLERYHGMYHHRETKRPCLFVGSVTFLVEKTVIIICHDRLGTHVRKFEHIWQLCGVVLSAGLPTKTWGSDHMSLVVDLSFAPPPLTQTQTQTQTQMAMEPVSMQLQR
jgi:hypothetical protein